MVKAISEDKTQKAFWKAVNEEIKKRARFKKQLEKKRKVR